jgi:hypothetical protein
MKAKLPTLLRAPKAEDINFIYSSWLKSYRNSEDANRMTNEVYYGNYKKTIEGILLNSRAIITCNPEDIDQVYGYVVYQNYNNITILHYAYTKYTYRKLGVAQELISSIFPEITKTPLVVTSANRVFDKLKEKYLLLYNPFVKLLKETENHEENNKS